MHCVISVMPGMGVMVPLVMCAARHNTKLKVVYSTLHVLIKNAILDMVKFMAIIQ